jgi:protein-disulfide isomerase
MKKLLLSLAATIFVTLSAFAVPADEAALRAYVLKSLPRCPDAVLTLTPYGAGQGPVGFNVYQARLESSDQYCGTQKYLLYSPKSDQVFLGTVIPLAADGRPVAARVGEKASELLHKPHTATVAPFPLPDGLKAVTIARTTPDGNFGYHGFVDLSGQYLMIGTRGNVRTAPAQTLRDAIGIENGVRRGNKASKLEIIELSDFQCPSCGRAHERLEPLFAKNLSKINYIRIDLPLFEQHRYALQAAAAARTIQRIAPAKYWELADFLFKNQEQLETANFDTFIKGWVEDHDIDWAAFNKTYSSKGERQAILDQVGRAFDLGIASTPTFIVNGQMVGYGADGKMLLDILAANGITGAAPKPAAKPAAAKPAPTKKPAPKKP